MTIFIVHNFYNLSLQFNILKSICVFKTSFCKTYIYNRHFKQKKKHLFYIYIPLKLLFGNYVIVRDFEHFSGSK